MNAANGTVVTNCKNYLTFEKALHPRHSDVAKCRLLALSVALAMAGNLLLTGVCWSKPDSEPIQGPLGKSTLPAGSGESSDEITIFGVEMQEAFGRHFFAHFRFRPIGISVTSDGFTEMLLRLPRSSRFRPFINLFVALDGNGKIIRARIQMKRRFIEDKVQGAFARDYAKSFVQAAVPEYEYDKVRLIANEIFFRQDITKVTDVAVKSDKTEGATDKAVPATVFKLGTGKLKEGDIIIMGEGGVLPELPKKPSDLYRCFVGKTKTCKLNMTDATLKFSNEQIEGEETLVISVSSKDDPDDLPRKKEVDYGNLPLHIPGNL